MGKVCRKGLQGRFTRKAHGKDPWEKLLGKVHGKCNVTPNLHGKVHGNGSQPEPQEKVTGNAYGKIQRKGPVAKGPQEKFMGKLHRKCTWEGPRERFTGKAHGKGHGTHGEVHETGFHD